jgi:hypothetical protein
LVAIHAVGGGLEDLEGIGGADVAADVFEDRGVGGDGGGEGREVVE